MTVNFPPGLILILGALLLPLLRGKASFAYTLALPLLTLLAMWNLPESGLFIPFLDNYLNPVHAHPASHIFGTVFALMAFAGGWYAHHQSHLLERVAAFIYAGGAIGVTFAGDLFTLFVFWETMAIGSTLVIWSGGTEAAHRAGMRYLMLHLLGGVILFAGIASWVVNSGNLTFQALPHDSRTFLILVGVLLNAGAPPFSCWLADAYPEASPGGTVFLSAFTTKTAVFVLLTAFPGHELLIPIGLFMALYGIVYALLENDMRRILAYSIVNQVGFMVCGIGIGTPLAINGAASHAFAHIIYKALLLMAAGSVLHQTGKRLCTDLGGLFRTMPLTTACGTIGALAISAFPFTSGFVTKSMISTAAANEHLFVPWLLLTAASAGVFLHAGIKFPWFVFFQKDSGLRPPEPPLNMRIPMLFFAFLCIAIGCFPEPLYQILPHRLSAEGITELKHEMFSPTHLVTQFQLLLFAGLAFFVLLPLMQRTRTISLDVDWLYRKPLPWLGTRLLTAALATVAWLESRLRRPLAPLHDKINACLGPHGFMHRHHSTNNMTLWVILMLFLIMLLRFF